MAQRKKSVFSRFKKNRQKLKDDEPVEEASEQLVQKSEEQQVQEPSSSDGQPDVTNAEPQGDQYEPPSPIISANDQSEAQCENQPGVAANPTSSFNIDNEDVNADASFQEDEGWTPFDSETFKSWEAENDPVANANGIIADLEQEQIKKVEQEAADNVPATEEPQEQPEATENVSATEQCATGDPAFEENATEGHTDDQPPIAEAEEQPEEENTPLATYAKECAGYAAEKMNLAFSYISVCAGDIAAGFTEDLDEENTLVASPDEATVMTKDSVTVDGTVNDSVDIDGTTVETSRDYSIATEVTEANEMEGIPEENEEDTPDEAVTKENEEDTPDEAVTNKEDASEAGSQDSPVPREPEAAGTDEATEPKQKPLLDSWLGGFMTEDDMSLNALAKRASNNLPEQYQPS